MLDTLRRRLIVSHILPLLVIVPVMGIALIYVLETRVVLPDLEDELTGAAALVAGLAKDQPEVFKDPAQAEKFVANLRQQVRLRIMLLDSDGRLLASSDASDTQHLGQRPDSLALADALAGKMSVVISNSQELQGEILDAWYPVFGLDQHLLGVIRLSHHLDTVQEEILRLRYLITGILAAGLVIGIAVGLLLAVNISGPLSQLTQAVWELARGRHYTPLTEQGPQEIRVLLQAVNTLVGRLRDMEQARHRLLDNLVHELGRPLGALHSAIHALRGGAVKDEALHQELLAGMDEEIGRLRNLLDELAQLHTQVLGTLELDRRSIHLAEWLPHTLVTWREAAQEKGLYWETDIPAELPTLQADPDQLARALGNLLSNAVKYTPAGGAVSVKADVENGEVSIRVSDTGPGISPEAQAHIFTPYYRGPSAAHFSRGMGLGLSIAHDLVVAHGGRLEVDSSLGQGSHFTIWMPLTPK